MKTAVRIFRFIGLISFGIAGFFGGVEILKLIPSITNPLPYAVGAAVVGALLGFLVTPYITVYPVNWFRNYLNKVSSATLLYSLIGLVIGLIIAALATIPLSRLPGALSSILPFAAAVLFGYLGVAIAISRQG